MSPTSTQPVLDFPKQVVTLFLNAIEEGNKEGARMLWSILTTFLKEHWFFVVGSLFVVSIIFTCKAMMGRWGSLGSFLYNFFYFGTLFIIGSIWGPEVFVNDIFNAICTAILYPVCYIFVGIILDKMKLRIS